MSILSPKNTFLLDGIGALVTAGMHGLVLPALGDRIGLPTPALQALGIAALLFATYSLCCYTLFAKTGPKALRTIAVANGLFCLASFALLGWHAATVGFLGWAYFAGEGLVISFLVRLEWQIANTWSPRKNGPQQ